MKKDAEYYLVKILQIGRDAQNFSVFQTDILHHAKDSSQLKLPPTSEGILPHIQRAFYNAYNIVHALKVQLDQDPSLLLKQNNLAIKTNNDSLYWQFHGKR